MGGIVIVDSVSGGTTDGANKDLSNLTVTGEARFTAKAGVDLDNISSAGVSVITSYATGGGANTDLSNLSVTGQAVIDGRDIGLEIGSLICSSLPILNAVKYVLADGTQYSTTGVYQAFADYLAQVKLTHPQCFVTQAEFDADVASKGQCGRYVLDTVNFRVPKITRFIGATVNLADIGKAWSESLPNITGGLYNNNNTFQEIGLDAGVASGAIQIETDSISRQSNENVPGFNNYNLGWSFDASLSSSTYQDGAKVNPERVTYPYYIVVSNAGQMTPVEININNVMADLALKADKDLDNTIPSQAFKETVVGWGMPDYSAGVSVSYTTLNSGFEAPNDGIITGSWNPLSSNTLVYVNGKIVGGGNTYVQTLHARLSKGDIVKAASDTTDNTIVFYPLKGVN